MQRWMIACLAAAAAAAPAAAHFLWIIPSQDDKNRVLVVFSDRLAPDDPALLNKVEKTDLWLRDDAGKESQLTWKKGKDAFLVELSGEGRRVIGGVCYYGVVNRGGKELLLCYYPKLILGSLGKPEPWSRLPVEILPLTEGGLTFRVVHGGKPVAGAEVVVLRPGEEKSESLTTNDKGEVSLTRPAPGQYGVRARVNEAKAGQHGDHKYEEVRHYATLVMNYAAAAPNNDGKSDPLDKLQSDPAATRMLADARAARAAWEDFPGFVADIEVNLDGKVFKGKLTVDSKARIQLEGLDSDAHTWAERVLKSLAAHRMPGRERDTPCAFADDNKDHPLGRAIVVLNDELHSSYRIRGNEIVVVNRTMKDSRFSITMLESRTNPEGKVLPASYVVHYWNAKTGELQRTESTFNAWKRVGKFDLPETVRVITVTQELTARSLQLSNHRLNVEK